MRLPSSLQDHLNRTPSRSKGGRYGSSWWYNEQRPGLNCTSASLPLPWYRGSTYPPNQSQHSGSYHVLMPSMKESQWSILKLQLRICGRIFAMLTNCFVDRRLVGTVLMPSIETPLCISSDDRLESSNDVGVQLLFCRTEKKKEIE